MKKIVPFLFLTFSGCYCNHLYVQEERVDRKFLASSYVHTPDHRQDHPPVGERLLIGWDFPKSLFQKELFLEVSVRFWDEKEEIKEVPLLRKRGSTALFFSEKKILTYLVRVFTKEGEVIETWKHHFWTDWIDIGKGDNFSSAKHKRSSVSLQPMQESVIERP